MKHLNPSKNFLCVLLLHLLFFNLFSCKGSTNQTSPAPAIKIASSTLDSKYQLDKIKLPEGFSISIYAEVPNARSMTLSPGGVLYVGNRNKDKVYAVTDDNKDGRGDKVYTLASGLKSPNGVAFRDGKLYVATISSILRFDNIEADLSNPPAPVAVYNKYPRDAHHGWKFIAFGPDGKLYVPVGAPCNTCDRKEPIYASITRMDPDGSNFEIYARGIRNTVGFTWHPVTKALWFTDNGSDNLGNDLPSDELNMASGGGLHFGYPYCHQGNTPDPEFGIGRKCSDFVPPAQLLGPHVAALGIRFYTGNLFPAEFRNQAFIAEHGSWNRATPIGYRVSLVQFDENGKAISYTDFASGWLQKDGKVLGRPVDIQQMPDGSILVSDDYSGVIYRITYSKK
jgi:glucose/arabinose dehydrogenase